MTIISADLKILAADSLTTAGDTKVYFRSKIRIIKQHAIASTGMENDGFRFEKWFFEQNGEPFICEEDFAAVILNKSKFLVAETKEDDRTLAKTWEPNHKFSIGTPAAQAVAEGLMAFAGFNAHKAAAAAARYHTHCGEPVYSITKAQLDAIHPDFDGYWVGDYKVPLAKIEQYLITHQQWLKT
jgi:hypothetical protein